MTITTLTSGELEEDVIKIVLYPQEANIIASQCASLYTTCSSSEFYIVPKLEWILSCGKSFLITHLVPLSSCVMQMHV